MTDKQIIIDGVDVSGCGCIIQDYQRANNIEGRYEHIKNVCELGERSAEYYNLFCKDNSNCYYKQLKRKEQECEFSNLRIIQLQETLSQYETDLSTKDCIVETCKAQYKELKAENDLFRTCHDNEQAKRRKYGQAIEDIKEIAKKTLNMVDYKTYFKRNNKSLKQEGFKALNEILQKISEVEK